MRTRVAGYVMAAFLGAALFHVGCSDGSGGRAACGGRRRCGGWRRHRAWRQRGGGRRRSRGHRRGRRWRRERPGWRRHRRWRASRDLHQLERGVRVADRLRLRRLRQHQQRLRGGVRRDRRDRRGLPGLHRAVRAELLLLRIPDLLGPHRGRRPARLPGMRGGRALISALPPRAPRPSQKPESKPRQRTSLGIEAAPADFTGN